MDHYDHVRLIKKAAIGKEERWADLGSGEGAFTLALRDIAGENVEIFSIDKDRSRLEKQKQDFLIYFPNTNIHFINSDFLDKIDLPTLDGVIIANALHFYKNPLNILKKIHSYLKTKGELIIIEYNSSKGNMWVPYPIQFSKLYDLLDKANFEKPEKMSAFPSDFLNEIYSAITFKK